MLLGYNPINLDTKGRLAIPTKYRQELQDLCECKLILTLNQDRCLSLYPTPQWEVIQEKLRKAPALNKNVKKLQRLIFGHATYCEMDGQGRVTLPEKLREFAGLNKRVSLIGQLTMFEIWDEDCWNSNCNQWNEEVSLKDLDDISPELSSLPL